MGLANVLLRSAPQETQMLAQMREDARFDVGDDDGACVPDWGSVTAIHAPAAPPKVPKVFLSNDCVFNCAYCTCRVTRDCRRYALQPRELARLSVLEAERQHRGIFLTSAIYRGADYTQELIIETLKIIRRDHGFGGYVHAKVMPGADPALIAEAGRWANRLSVNIEVARSEGYRAVAKQKNRENILMPMRTISEMIAEGKGSRQMPFATSQTTQLMAGAAGEDDRTILTLSRALYDRYRLRRVYYTAFHYTHPAKGYDLEPVDTPSWRMARLYQADRLMQLYGFRPEELADASAPNLAQDVDPKTAWALRNLHLFPVDVQTAEYEMLLRVPGIGVTAAQRIVAARRLGRLDYEGLRRIGVSLKRSRFFISCGGRGAPGFTFAPDLPGLRTVLAGERGREQLTLDF
jgi:putative DNA modification/repair radical SAM protein